MDYSLVPERDRDGGETGFYTREPDGVSGMTVGALAKFVGAAQTATVTQLLDRIENSDPLTNSLPECLKEFAGDDLRLLTNDLQGRLIIPDEACYAIAEYYAFDAREYSGKSTAVKNYRMVGRPGMRVFIWSRTGYVPPTFREQREPIRGTYWYERVKVALSDIEKPLQAGYFCAYLEMMKFFQELEVHASYIVPDTDPETGKYIVPDISIGQMFNSWLRSDSEEAKSARLEFLGSDEPVDFRKDRFNKVNGRKVRVPAGLHRSEIVEYVHVYPEESHGDNNRILVNSYPDKYLLIFKHYLSDYWIPNECKRYLSKRDLKGWTMAEDSLSILPAYQRQALAGTYIGRLLPALPPAKE